jgi:hypothetical protein
MTDQELSQAGEGGDEPLFSPGALLGLAYSWSTISKDQLVKAGVIGPGSGGSDWKRFNDDPMMFIMKLPRERLPALCRLIG